jgi:large subunit ribosomal protein L11
MAQVAKGAKEPSREKAGQITKGQLEEIAKQKMPDLNTTDLKMAMHSIAGTARSMGIEIVE